MFSWLFKKKDSKPMSKKDVRKENKRLRQEHQIEKERKYEAKELVSVKASDSLYYKNEKYVEVVINGFKELGYSTHIGEFDKDAVYFVVDRINKKVVGLGSVSGWPKDSIDIVQLAKLDLLNEAP